MRQLREGQCGLGPYLYGLVERLYRCKLIVTRNDGSVSYGARECSNSMENAVYRCDVWQGKVVVSEFYYV